MVIRSTFLFIFMIIGFVSFAQRDTTLYYESGEKRAEGQTKDGAEYGTWFFYYKSGQKMSEVPHLNGYSHGLVKDWYPTGELKSETEFKFGGRNGNYTSWFKNGAKMKQGQYRDGKSGEWKYWNEEGQLILKSHWENDFENGLLQYYENEKLMVEQNWVAGKIHGDVIYFDQKEKPEIIRKYINDTVITEKYKSRKPKYDRNSLKTVTSINSQDSSLPKRVSIIGEYNQLNVSYNPAVKSYTGRCFIWVNDTTSIMIGSGELGIRPLSEIQMHNNKNVEVIGMLYPTCNAWGNGSQQTIVMPCIREVREVNLKED